MSTLSLSHANATANRRRKARARARGRIAVIVLPVLAACAALIAGPIFMRGPSDGGVPSGTTVFAASPAAALDNQNNTVIATSVDDATAGGGASSDGAMVLASVNEDEQSSSNSPATRPSMRPSGPGGPGIIGAAGGGSGGGLRNAFRGPQVPLTEKDLADAEQFIKDNLPNRWRLLSGLPPQMPVRRKAIELAAMKYRAMVRLRESDPELYDAFLQQEKLRDRAVGLVEQSRNGDGAADEGLRRTVADLVDASLRERQTRIDRLEKQLDDLKQQFRRDDRHREAIADEETRRIRNQTNLLLDRLDGLRRFRSKDRGAPSSAGAGGPGITSEEGGVHRSESTPPTSRPAAATQP